MSFLYGAGILFAMLCWTEAHEQEASSEVAARLEELSQLAVPFGSAMSWPRKIGGSIDDSMPGWCNGSAGFVQLFAAAHCVLKDSRYLELARRAACDAADHKDSATNLCCGLVGRCLAILQLYQFTEDNRLLDITRELLDRIFAVNKKESFPDGSLYKGNLGIVLLAAERVSPSQAAIPIFGQLRPGDLLHKPSQ